MNMNIAMNKLWCSSTRSIIGLPQRNRRAAAAAASSSSFCSSCWVGECVTLAARSTRMTTAVAAGAGSGFPQNTRRVAYKSTAAAATRPSSWNDSSVHHHSSASPVPTTTTMPAWFRPLSPAGQQSTSSLMFQQPPAQKPRKNPIQPNTNKKTTSIKQLVQQVPQIVRERKEKDIAPGSPEDPILQLFRQTHLTADEWSRYAFFDSSRPYTRNLIATDHETYTLLLLCWNPQHESPIHDHPCDGCWLQVLQGSIQECRYSPSLSSSSESASSSSSSRSKSDDSKHTDFLECTLDQTLDAGQIAYITDNMGYHKIGNPTLDQPAISLHLYAPPIHQCRTWRLPGDDEEDNVGMLYHHQQKETEGDGSSTGGSTGGTGMICQETSCAATHYSEYGFRVA